MCLINFFCFLFLGGVAQNEMNVLRKLSHPNLIRLLGYCKEENAAFHLVYEFMANGSLQDHLLESEYTVF